MPDELHYPDLYVLACQRFGLHPAECLSYRIYKDQIAIIARDGRKFVVDLEDLRVASPEAELLGPALDSPYAGFIWPPSIDDRRRAHFEQIGLTPARAAEMTDQELLALERIGPATVRLIRQVLAEIGSH